MKMDILWFYGDGLPNAGVIFLAPVVRGCFSAKIVREAYRTLAIFWPPNRLPSYETGRPTKSIYRDRYNSGELANDETEKILALKSFEGAKFKWDGESFTDRF